MRELILRDLKNFFFLFPQGSSAHYTKNEETVQENKIKCKTNNEANRERRKNHHISTDSPQYQDSSTAETNEGSEENCLPEHENKISKSCDKDDLESTKKCLDFDTEMVCEKRSSFIGPTHSNNDITEDKVEFDDNNAGISENIENTEINIELVKGSNGASKLATDSINVEESLKGMNEDIDVKEKTLNEHLVSNGYSLKMKEINYIKATSKDTFVPEANLSHLSVTNKNKVESDDNSIGVGEDIKNTETNIGLVKGNDCSGKHTTDAINVEEMLKYLPIANEYKLEFRQNVPDKEQPLNEISVFTKICSEREDNATNKNELDIAHSAPQKERSLNEDYATVSEFCGDFFKLENDLEILSTRSENELDLDKTVLDKRQPNDDSNCAEFLPAERDDKDFGKDSAYLIKPKNDEEGSLSTHERELDKDEVVVSDLGQALNEDSNYPEFSPAESDDSDFCKVSAYFLKPKNDESDSLSTHERELDMDEEVVSDQGQALNEDSNCAEFSPAERDDKDFCKDCPYLNKPKNVKAVPLSTHERESDIDIGQPLNESATCIEYYSAEKVEIGSGKNSSDSIDIEVDLGSSYAEDKYIVYDISEKNTPSPEDSTYTDSCQETEDMVFHKHNTYFNNVQENINLCAIKRNELSMNKKNTNDKEETSNAHSVSNGCCLETKETYYVKAGQDTFDPEADLDCISGLHMEKHVHKCCLEGEELHVSKQIPNAIDPRDGVLIPSSSNESKLNMFENFSDVKHASDKDQAYIVCRTEHEGTELVVITHQDLATEDTFGIDQETGFVKECASYGDEHSALKKEKDDDMKELFNSVMESESPEKCSSGIFKDSTMCEIVSSHIGNENEHIVDKELFQEELTFCERCSNNENEVEKTYEPDHENFNMDHESESIDERLFDICEECLLYENGIYETGGFNSDKENDQSLSDISDHSALLYEVVSLSSRSENDFYTDEYFSSKELSLDRDSEFLRCYSKHEKTEMQCTSPDVDAESFNLNAETESLNDHGNFERDRKNCECLSDVSEGTDSGLYETLSFCKIDKEECYDCFEEADIACCCQCCECIGNPD